MLASDAAEWTVQYYDDLIPESDFVPEPFEDDTLEPRLAASARFAIQENATDAFLEGTGIRAIHDHARSTLIQNVEREGGKWYRIPRAEACGFCRLLATRGPVYKSAHAAAASHDHCECKVAVQRPGMTVERPTYMRSWDNEYRKYRSEVIRAGQQPSLDNIVNAWNRGIRADQRARGVDTDTRDVA